ncbi:MAG TPA: ribonuclease P protein component [Thermoanaerobaculia bacterium]|nr:ribonuclease P protein component [Thermoanaerobaculia bacterium]
MRGHPGPPASGTPEQLTAVAPGLAAATGTEGLPAPRRSPPPAGEGLPSRERLLRRADYLRCYRTGRRRQGALLMLYLVPNLLDHPRIGVTTSRKVGNSVVRHRLKRWIKEIYRRWSGRANLAALDLVAHLKLEAKSADFGAVRRDLLGLLNGLGGAGVGARSTGGAGGHRRPPRRATPG